MKISIITVCLNSSSTIERTIKSVLEQTFKDIEYIIIDGMSTDNTMEIVHFYDVSIHKIISEKDKGLYDAMNKGLSLATGDVVGILNSDDVFFQNDVLQSVNDLFTQHNDLSMVYGDIVYVSSNDPQKVVRNWKSTSYYDKFFEQGHVPPHPSLFIKRTDLEKVGLFNLKYKLAADYEFMLRCFKVANLKSLYLDKYFVKMQLGGQTNASFANILKGNKEILDAWKTNGFRLPILLIPYRIVNRLLQFVK